MKTIQLVTCIVLMMVASSIYAQDKPKNFIGFTVGASIPMGDFAKADAGSFGNWNNTAGFAKTGFALGVEGAYYLGANFGIGGTLYFSDHGGFSSSDARILANSYTDAFGVDESTVTTTGSYRSLNVMIGPCFSFPMNKFTIDVRAFGGLLKSFSTPEMTVQLEDNVDSKFTQTSSTASAFGWQVGAGFRYALSDKMGLMFRADYFGSEGVTIENENRTNAAGRLVTKQPMAWLNTSVGLSFLLGK